MSWWWLWILVAAASVGLLLYFSPIAVHLTYSRLQGDDKLKLTVKVLYGMISFKFKVPLMRFQGLLKGFSVKTDTDYKEPDKKDFEPNPTRHINKDEIVDFYLKLKHAVRHTFGMVDWLKETMSMVHFTQLDWTTRIGIGDAADTAITTGLIWGIKSSTLGYLFQFLHLDAKARINVVPMYNQTLFTTECLCIAKIRLGHAIIAGLHLLVRILRVKGGIKAWQNILFKAS